jgi:putative membrane protein
MTDSVVAAGAGRFEVRVTSDSHFSWVRTRLSLERTMMSWLRTATALIGFGFAIVQSFNRLAETAGARAA